MRPLPAALLALPGVLLAAWYGWQAFAGLDAARRALAPERGLTVEDYQLALYDALRCDLRRFGMPDPPRRRRIPHLELRLSNKNLDLLEAGARKSEKRPYVSARLAQAAREVKVKAHLRGAQPWHWLRPQKSLKLKLDGEAQDVAELFLGGRVLNLVNDPNPVPVADEAILGVARELDLLTPASGFARLALNGADLGVFRTSGQVDESVLRASPRFPGSLYSGNLPSGVPSEALWSGPERWKKVSWEPGEEKKRSDLERLLQAVSQDSLAEFEEFARHEVDLERFAALEALEIAFGVAERDERRNHKLYLDPHRGRWEPVAWSLRGFRHRNAINLVDHPLGLRLKLVPGYLTLRARALHDLLSGPARPAAVRRRMLDQLELLWPELTTDPHWDAIKLLPEADAFLRRMPRPMDEERLVQVVEAELANFAARHAYLRERLGRLALVHQLGEPRSTAGGVQTALVLWLEGQSGVRLQGFRVEFAPECREPEWQVLARGIPVTARGRGAELLCSAELSLEPVARLVAGMEGSLEAEPAPTRFELQLVSSCAPVRAQAWGNRLDDDTRVGSHAPAPGEPVPQAVVPADPATVPSLTPGQTGPHPWAFVPLPPEVVRLGPGEVRLDGQRVYERQQRVVVAPGTRLRLGPGAGLICLGRLEVNGSTEAPVRLEAAGAEPFGGLVLQGPGAAGSLLRHLEIRGGDRPAWRSVTYTAALNIHDTERVRLEDCRISGAAREGLHAGSVRDLVVDGLVVEDAAGDAVDLEFVEGRLLRLELLRPGDDGLDLMGGRLELADSVVVGAANNAVSAGEEVKLSLHDCLLAGSQFGLRVKNGSRVTIAGSLVFDAGTGLAVEGPGVFYPRRSRLLADELGLVNLEQEAHVSKRVARRVDLSRVFRALSDAGGLDRLRREVLGLGSWNELAGWVRQRRVRGTP